MNPQQNYMPAQKSYLDFMSQAPPTQEDNQMGFWGRLASGLTGAAANLAQPGSGTGITQGLLDDKYNRAMQDYRTKGESLGRAAQSEQGLAGLARQMSNDQFQRSQFGSELDLKQAGLGLERDKLTQQGALGNREIDLKSKTFENQLLQQGYDRALQEKKISIDQYNSATQRLNAETNQTQGTAQANYWNQLGQAKLNPPDKAPSAPLLEMQAGSRIQTDPILSQRDFMTRDNDGNFVFDPQKAMKNPQAAERLIQIYRDLGLLK